MIGPSTHYAAAARRAAIAASSEATSAPIIPAPVDSPNRANHTSASGKRPSLKANAAWSFTGTLLYSGCQWLSYVVLAKLGSAATVGTFALAVGITTPAFMLFNLNLRAIQATDARGRYSFGTIWAVRTMTSVLALIGISIYSLATVSDRELAVVVALVALARFFESLTDAIHGRLQRAERLAWIARSLALRGLLGFLLVTTVYWATRSLPAAALGMAGGSLLPLLASDLRALRRVNDAGSSPVSLRPRPVRAEFGPLLRSALPLGGTMMLISLNTNIPRYFLEAYAGRAVVGMFAAVTQLVAVGNLAISALAQASSPRLARAASSGNFGEFKKLTIMLYGLVSFTAIAGLTTAVVFGETILTSVFRPEYSEAASSLILLSVAGGLSFAGSVAGYALTALGVHGRQLPLFLLISATSLTAAAIFIPRFGLIGGAMSVTATAFVQLGASTLLLRLALGKDKGLRRHA